MDSLVMRLCAILAFISFCSAVLPPVIKVCPRNDPKLALCFKNSMESLKPLLKNGQIAPGFNIEPLDPLFIGDLSINRGFDMKLFAVQAYGIANFKVEKVRVNVEKLKIEILVSIPKITTSSKYSLNWKLALLNIQGAGDAHANLGNVRVIIKLSGSEYVQNGVTKIKIDEAKVELKPATIKIRFDNLFNGNKGLEDIANEAINQNIHLLEQEIIPQVERGVAVKVMKVANQVLERGSSAEFFPY